MAKITLEDFKKEALSKPSVKKIYQEITPEYDLKLKLIKMRKKANLTQEELAEEMDTKRSNISRLESFTYKSSPNIATLIAYAKATGHKMKIDFL